MHRDVCVELLLKYMGVDLDENAVAHMVHTFFYLNFLLEASYILFFSFCVDFFSSLCEYSFSRSCEDFNIIITLFLFSLTVDPLHTLAVHNLARAN